MITRPQSLRGLTILFLTLFLTVTVLAGLSTFFGTLSTINALVDARIETESYSLAPRLASIDRTELERRIEDMGRQRETGDLGLLLTDGQGRRIAGNVSLGRTLPLGLSALGKQDRIQGLSSGRALVRSVGGGMRLAVFAETEPFDHYFAARRRIYLLGFGAIVAVVLGGLLLFRRLVAQRIEDMRQTVASIIAGDLSRRVPLNGDGGEFDQQAAAFNQMLDRMNGLMAEIRNVSNDISHELRTPLAKLRNELALLQEQPDAFPLRRQLAQATRQADDLLGMFGAMLRIAEIESGSRRADFRPLDCGALLDEVIEMMQPVAEEAGQRLAIGQRDNAHMVGDRQLLAQMLLNLVENGLRHTARGAVVTLSVVTEQGLVRMIIEDDGPGISADQRPLVMRRFGRLDHRRRGHGLGLPLADAIVRLHGGTLVLEDAAPGLRVVLVFPL